MTNGLTVNYTYDARNRLTSETNGAGETIKYAYDKLGNRISMTDPRGSAAADGTFTTWYVYDVLNRDIRTVMPDTTVPADPYGNPALFDNPCIEYTYYPNGLKETEKDPTA
jgi:YD repeat-containing protein